MFRHFTLAIFRLRNEKKLSTQLYSTCVGCIQWGGEVGTRSRCVLSFFISQPEVGQCQVPKHVIVLYVINSIHISIITQLC